MIIRHRWRARLSGSKSLRRPPDIRADKTALRERTAQQLGTKAKLLSSELCPLELVAAFHANHPARAWRNEGPAKLDSSDHLVEVLLVENVVSKNR